MSDLALISLTRATVPDTMTSQSRCWIKRSGATTNASGAVGSLASDRRPRGSPTAEGTWSSTSAVAMQSYPWRADLIVRSFSGGRSRWASNPSCSGARFPPRRVAEVHRAASRYLALQRRRVTMFSLVKHSASAALLLICLTVAG